MSFSTEKNEPNYSPSHREGAGGCVMQRRVNSKETKAHKEEEARPPMKGLLDRLGYASSHRTAWRIYFCNKA